VVVDERLRGRMHANSMPQIIHSCQKNGHK
jgi:hypothetical protein